VGLKLNGTHQLLAYAEDLKLLGNNIDTIKKNTGTLIDTSKEVGLEMNVEETKYRLLSRHQMQDLLATPAFTFVTYTKISLNTNRP
jgi:hypothetical protein